MAKFRIQVNGLKELRKKAKEDATIGEPMRGAYTEAAAIGKAEVDRRAPRMSGKTAGAVYSNVDKKPLPKWGAVRMRTVNRASRGGKFRYPWALNYSKKRKYVYRASGSGLTFDWFTGAIRTVKDRIGGILNTAAREIEKTWQT